LEDLKKTYKVFSLIRLLNTPPAKDAKQLMRILDIKKTYFYDLIKLLERLGYMIQTDGQNRKSLQIAVTKNGRDLIEPQELAHIKEILQGSGNHPLTTALLNKFDANLALIPLADVLPQLHANRNIQLIRAGINGGRCLILRNYLSLSSQTVKDRMIEPLELTDDYRYLIGWEQAINRQGQFKINRITDVDILEDRVTPNRIASPLDIFGLTGDEWLSVRLELSPLAHNLMVEEFPLSVRFINRYKTPILFDGRVRNWKGIGRFVLGLPGEIKVLKPQGFKDFLKEKIVKFQ